MKKRILSLVLAVLMIVTILPAEAFASIIDDLLDRPVITITQQPKAESVEVGQTATFSIKATSTLNAELKYIWCDREKLEAIDFTEVGDWTHEIGNFLTGSSVYDQIMNMLSDARLGTGSELMLRNCQKSIEVQCIIVATTASKLKYSVAFSDTVKLTVRSGEACETHVLGVNLIKHEAVQNDCKTEGNLEYYECIDCGCCYLDEACTQRTTKQAVTLARTTDHEIEHHAPTPGTCTKRSTFEYWECTVCGQYFSDPNGKKPIAEIPTGEKNMTKHGDLAHYHAVASTCCEQGNVEYWQCADCGKCYLDLECTKEIDDSKVDIDRDKTNHSNIKKIEATEPTCTEKGNREYYYCSGCDDYFTDRAGTVKTTPSKQELPAKGHSFTTYSSDADSHYLICNVCNQKDEPEKHYGGVADCAHGKICEKCGAEYGSRDPEVHNNTTYVNVVPATPYANGNSGDLKCLDCGRVLERGSVTPKLCLHADPESGVLQHVNAKDATCTRDGNIEYWHCTVCDKYWSNDALTNQISKEDTVIKAAGHLIDGKPNPDIAIMRNSAVQHWYVCRICGEEIFGTRESHIWSNDTPTCCSGKHCTVCGIDNGQRDMANHFGATEVRGRIESINGSKGYTGDTYCLGCGNIISIGSDYYDKCYNGCKELVRHEAVAATCTTDGKSAYYECTVCHKLYKDSTATLPTTESETVIPAPGHDLHPGKDFLSGSISSILGSDIYYRIYRELTSGSGSVSESDIFAAAKIKDLGAGNFCYDGSGHWLGCQRCGKTYAELAAEGTLSGMSIDQSILDKSIKQPHTGGEADCKHRARCSECGVEYGELGEHHYNENNYCTVCGKVTKGCEAPVLSMQNENGAIKLSWNTVSGAKAYQVYCNDKKIGEYSLVATVDGTSYIASFASTGSSYYFKVRALGTDGTYGTFSTIQSLLTAPVVRSSNDPATGKIRLTWESVPGAVKYEVYRAGSSAGEYKLFYTTTCTSYLNTSATAGYTYYYKVVAITQSGERSKDSNIAYRTVDCARPVVTGTNDAKTGKCKLTWKAVDGASKYEIYRSGSKNGTYTKYYTTTYTSYTNSSSNAGYTYYYKVVAISKRTSAANSADSEIVSRTCDCATPTVSIKLSSGHPRLSWSSVSGATSYVIYRSTSKTSGYTKYDTTKNTSYTNVSASAGKTYYYKVVAVSSRSSYADSAYSSPVGIKAK